MQEWSWRPISTNIYLHINVDKNGHGCCCNKPLEPVGDWSVCVSGAGDSAVICRMTVRSNERHEPWRAKLTPWWTTKIHHHWTNLLTQSLTFDLNISFSVVAAVCLWRAALPASLFASNSNNNNNSCDNNIQPPSRSVNKQTNRWQSDDIRPCAYFLSNSQTFKTSNLQIEYIHKSNLIG